MEFLPDPLGDRTVKDLPPPPNKPLKDSVLYPYKGIPFPFLNLILDE